MTVSLLPRPQCVICAQNDRLENTGGAVYIGLDTCAMVSLTTRYKWRLKSECLTTYYNAALLLFYSDLAQILARRSEKHLCATTSMSCCMTVVSGEFSEGVPDIAIRLASEAIG